MTNNKIRVRASNETPSYEMLKILFIFRMQHARASNTKPAQRRKAKSISTKPDFISPPNKTLQKATPIAKTISGKEARSRRGEGPITCAALRGVSGRRAAGVV